MIKLEDSGALTDLPATRTSAWPSGDGANVVELACAWLPLPLESSVSPSNR